jgi:ATP-dependent RNA helicase DeaD
VKLLHEAAGGDVDEEEIPSPEPPRRERETREPRAGGRPRAADSAVTRLFVGIGRRAGLRPQDLVGAIAGESGLNSREIGAIQITDRFSLVEVPDSAADMVIKALSRSTIRGRRPTVRRERFNR